MSKTKIHEKTILKLWISAGGRCEYEGCNKPLWRDELTLSEMNTAYIAHIIADCPDGPRGDIELSVKSASEFSNLMLLCDAHHRLIDREQVSMHPVKRLRDMKIQHEHRIELLTDVKEDKKSEVILYGANIGDHCSPVNYDYARTAMMPHRYPASPSGIVLEMRNSAFQDCDADFWRIESENLKRLYTSQIQPRLTDKSLSHLSIFAIAPQPLLILLGSLISDIPASEVYQLHREPAGWKWLDHPDGFEYKLEVPSSYNRQPALVLSLSATIIDSRVSAVLQEDYSIWRLTIDQPNNDFLKSKEQLQMFRKITRTLLDRIKAAHGEQSLLHVFPAVPVAIAVELGRIIMPKADLPMRIYDENKQLGGFSHAIDLNMRHRVEV